jgi:L-amino acid N-acyltransferase YncA
MTPSPLVRASFQSDVPAIAAIYAHYVLHGTASFELVPPDAQEIAQRRQQALERGLPYLVTEIDHSVVAYAYAAPYRTRPGYRFTVEDSIYVHPDFVGQGIGRLLLCALIEACEKASCRQMVAVIGGQNNEASIHLHRAFGFQHVGVLKSVGFKFGAWLDTTFMQRPLGAGNTSVPDAHVLPGTP